MRGASKIIFLFSPGFCSGLASENDLHSLIAECKCFHKEGAGNLAFSNYFMMLISKVSAQRFVYFFYDVDASLIAVSPCRNKMFTIVSRDVANEILLLIFESYRSNEECDGCKIELAEVCGKCRQRYVMELN